MAGRIAGASIFSTFVWTDPIICVPEGPKFADPALYQMGGLPAIGLIRLLRVRTRRAGQRYSRLKAAFATRAWYTLRIVRHKMEFDMWQRLY